MSHANGWVTKSRRKCYSWAMLSLSTTPVQQTPDFTFSATNLEDVNPHEDDLIVLSIILMGRKVSGSNWLGKLCICDVLGHLHGGFRYLENNYNLSMEYLLDSWENMWPIGGMFKYKIEGVNSNVSTLTRIKIWWSQTNKQEKTSKTKQASNWRRFGIWSWVSEWELDWQRTYA